MACARAASMACELPLFRYLGGANAALLPVPCLNVINGGRHSQNTVDFQEYMIAPHHAPSFAEAIRMGLETFRALKDLLHGEGYSTGVGDEGGFAPDLKSNEEAVEVILEGIVKAGFRPGDDISICLDPAASEMWEDGRYKFYKSDHSTKSSEEMVQLFADWVARYPIVLIEDPMGEKDWDGWKAITRELGAKVELVGDDVFCTNAKILAEGIAQGVGNSVLIKLNQIGTVSETLDTIELARASGYHCFMSHRSGETEDSFLADLTVAAGAGHVKTGPLAKGNVRYRCALLFHHDERDERRRDQARHQSRGKKTRVMMPKRAEQPQRRRRTNDGPERVHHPLESERPTIVLARHRTRQQRLPHRRPHAASEPGTRARKQDMSRLRRQPEGRRAERSDHVAKHRDRFSPTHLVRVVATAHLRKARQPIAHAFDKPQPRRRHAHRGEESGISVVAISCDQSLNKLASPIPSTVRLSHRDFGAVIAVV